MNCIQLFPKYSTDTEVCGKRSTAMILKLMLAVYCAAVAFAAPPGKQGTVHNNIIAIAT